MRPITSALCNQVKIITHRCFIKAWDDNNASHLTKGNLPYPDIQTALNYLSREDLRLVMGVLSRHCHLRAHFLKMRLQTSPTGRGCQLKDEMAGHILCGIR